MDTLVGTSISGYTLVRLLGEGGMGSVYLANDPAIGQQVAVKVIRTDLDAYTDSSAAQTALERFRQEARAVAGLDHLHILPLYRYGEEPTSSGQRAYMIMQYRPEGSLWDWLRRRADLAAGNIQPTQAERTAGLSINWPLGLEEVTEYLQQASSALQYAHDRGIVHRDIKPANFLLRIDMHEKTVHLLLSDFGLAKMFTASSATNTILGTPIYMAPEQFEGAARPESDQYALAVMVYYLLAGRPPFEGDPMQLMHQHLSAEMPSITSFNPNIPPYMNGVLTRALAKQPEQRFPSISAFAEAFAKLAKLPQASLTLAPQPSDGMRGFTEASAYSNPTVLDQALQPSPGPLGLPSHNPASHRSPNPLILPGLAHVGPDAHNTPSNAYQEPTMQHASSPTVYPDQGIYPTPAPGAVGNAYNQTPQLTHPAHGYVQAHMPPHRYAVPPQQPSRRSALGWILGATALVAVGGGAGAYAYWNNRSQGGQTGQAGQTSPTGQLSPTEQPGGPASNLPAHALHVLKGHTADVTSLSWLPDGSQVASGSLDATARLWSSAQGTVLTTIRTPLGLHTLAWSSDGDTLATGGESRDVDLWKADGTRASGHVVSWGAAIRALAWSRNDDFLYIGTYGNSVHALEVKNEKHLGKNIPAHITSIALSPDERFLVATLTSGLVYFADLRNLEQAATLPLINVAALAVAWSPDGAYVAVGYENNMAIVYNTVTQEEYLRLAHQGPVNSVAWQPHATIPTLATGAGDNTVNIWKIGATRSDSTQLPPYTGHTDAVLAVAWSNTNLLASGSKDRTVIIWQPPV